MCAAMSNNVCTLHLPASRGAPFLYSKTYTTTVVERSNHLVIEIDIDISNTVLLSVVSAILKPAYINNNKVHQVASRQPSTL